MRLLLIALFMAVGPHVSAQEAQGVTEETPGQHEGESQQKDTSKGHSWDLALPVKILEDPDQAKHASDRQAKSDKHDADDLKAQQRAAEGAVESAASSKRQEYLARWQLALSGFGVLALIVTIIYSIKATNAAVKSANESANGNNLIRKGQRAWIKVGLVPYRELRPLDGTGGFYSQITIVLENTGKSVATEVRAFIRPYVIDTSDQSPRNRAEQWLIERIYNRHSDEISRIIFPGESISWEPDLAMRSDELNAQRFILRVAAIVEYNTPEVKGPCRTYTNFDITGSEDNGVSRVIMLDDGPMPVERMRVQKNGIGYAT